jgi:hypothetical protein
VVTQKHCISPEFFDAMPGVKDYTWPEKRRASLEGNHCCFPCISGSGGRFARRIAIPRQAAGSSSAR